MKNEFKNCPKCNVAFECKVNDINNCQCNLPLKEETTSFLKKTDYDCLCSNCLTHYNKLIEKAKNHHFPNHKNAFIEETHYYREGNVWVFTELYHLLRGYCCENGCRHCVY